MNKFNSTHDRVSPCAVPRSMCTSSDVVSPHLTERAVQVFMARMYRQMGFLIPWCHSLYSRPSR
jgi:hypothetical protein